MRRLIAITGVLGFVLAGMALPAQADGVYHSQHIPLAPIGGSPLRSGFVENVHTDGPNVYAHEQYVLNGAAPDTTYQVVLTVYPTDPACSGSTLTVPTALVATNVVGNGSAYHVFTPSDADGLRGLTVGIIWTLMRGHAVAYTTACSTVHLD
jgi:hypothetical protein